MHGSPWTFSAHPVAWVVVAALAVAYGLAVRRPQWRATRRQIAMFASGLVLLLVCCSWPLADLAAHWSLTALVFQRLVLTLADLAAHWSLTALVFQRLVLTLAVPPLLILGTPQPIVVALTRPAPVDAIVRRCTRPVVAVVVVTVVAVGTLAVAAVQWQSSTTIGRGLLDLVLLLAGIALWAPVLHHLPGLGRPSAFGRAGYLIVQSIVPSFLAVVWIFARHPLYPAYAHARLFGLSPLTDQQLAGFVAKLGTIAALWTVAFVVLSRAQRASERGEDGETLTWADVERQLLRLDRYQRRDKIE